MTVVARSRVCSWQDGTTAVEGGLLRGVYTTRIGGCDGPSGRV
jgi:hypothetical protein